MRTCLLLSNCLLCLLVFQNHSFILYFVNCEFSRRNSDPGDRQAPKSQSRDTHSNVEIVPEQGQGHTNPITLPHSPTPSSTSSLATIKTNCTQSHSKLSLTKHFLSFWCLWCIIKYIVVVFRLKALIYNLIIII